MRLDDQQESSNVEDRRGSSGGSRIGGKSIGVVTIALALVAMYFGVYPSVVLNMGQGLNQSVPAESRPIPQDDPDAKFVAKVLGSTEETWAKIFQNSNQQYPAPKLVLFSGQTPTACGSGQAAMGPFYCLGGQKVYIDLSFYQEMKDRFKAQANEYSVRLELQADCYAGVWAHYTDGANRILEAGDVNKCDTLNVASI